MNASESTVRRVIRKVNNNISLNRKSGSGLKPKKMPKNKVKALCKRVDGRKGVSQIKLAKKYDITQQYVSKILIKNGINYYKRKTKPKVTENQKNVIKKRLNLLCKNEMKPSNGLEVVVDDESYFPLMGDNTPGNDGYYTSDNTNVNSDVKYKSKSKFQTKVLMWIAISSRGRSRPYFAEKNCSVDSNTYANECISKHLKPFLQKNYPNNDIIFWPDLASAHYARNTIETFEALNINFVKRGHNPPNIPQLRPIEKFWAHLKSRVYANCWEARDYDHMVSRIKSKLRDFCPDYFKDLMSKVKTNLRKAADRGHEYMFS
jgi:transposase